MRKRKSSGLYGKALAELSGLSQQQISGYEQGITIISANTLLQISFLFNVDVKRFFTGCIKTNNRLKTLNYKEKKIRKLTVTLSLLIRRTEEEEKPAAKNSPIRQYQQPAPSSRIIS
ncbi:helix-turn-helix domain-containing protein [Morganella morganii]